MEIAAALAFSQGIQSWSAAKNAARRRSVHGIETYYLDQNHERHALNLAARENGIPRGQVNVLQQTLAKLFGHVNRPPSIDRLDTGRRL